MSGGQSHCARWTLLALGCAGLCLAGLAAAEETAPARTVRIGLSGTLFRDVPEAIIGAMSRPFNQAMSAEVGIAGELVKAGDGYDLAGRLMDNREQLGIFTGFEFAWAKQKYPDLKPLAVAVAGKEPPHAVVVVPAGSAVKEWADLKGKCLSHPRAIRPHVQLYLDRQIQLLETRKNDFFRKVVVNPESTEVIDDVAEGVAEAGLVDNVTWDWYCKNKPKRTAKLRVALQSEKFPATVVAYYPGNLDDKTAKLLRKGMLNAHENATGKQLMSLWKMTGFEEVPKDFEQSLKEIAKAYPPPVKTDAKK